MIRLRLRALPRYAAGLLGLAVALFAPGATASEFALAVSPPRFELEVKPGERLTLDATGSTDPDGDDLTLLWEFYSEPGTYTGSLRVETNAPGTITFEAPKTNAVIHWILHATDNGKPPLTRYQRVVVSVQP